MDITIVTLIVSALTALLTGLFGALSHIKKCHAGCCDSDCTRSEEERERRRLQSRDNSKSDILTDLKTS